jgi:3-oxoacyl-[acyl-carrier protein] reductase
VAVPTDVSQSDKVRSLFAEVDRRFSSLDILVNNAGIGITDLERFNRTAETRGREFAETGAIATAWNVTSDMTDQAWREMLAVHLDGTFFCTREALKLMGRRNKGAIINVASTAGLTGQEGGHAGNISACPQEFLHRKKEMPGQSILQLPLHKIESLDALVPS